MGGPDRVRRVACGVRTGRDWLTRVAIISHDAGGAEILASYTARTGPDAQFVLAGPAVKIFERRIGTVAVAPLHAAVDWCDMVLCGTSWQSDLEWQALGLARSLGKRSAAFLDHWVNYRERFVRGGVEHLPDEIWVGDREAAALAGRVFRGVPVREEENPYLIDIREELRGLAAGGIPHTTPGHTALFIGENISEHQLVRHGNAKHLGYDEFDAIEYFLESSRSLEVPVDSVVIRPHPSDAAGKYEKIQRQHAGRVTISSGRTLLEDILASDVVAGCESMAMVVGLMCNKLVVSCIPPQGQPCRLPHAGILRLNGL